MSKFHCKVLRVVCLFALILNIYFLVRILSNDEIVLITSQLDIISTYYNRPTTTSPHPFAHLLPKGKIRQQHHCKRPKLSLQHDALSFAFHTMDPLTCEGGNYFTFHKGHLVPNKTELSKWKVRQCALSAIRRYSDEDSYLHDLDQDPLLGKFLVEEDFLYVNCEVGYNVDEENEKNSRDFPAFSDTVLEVTTKESTHMTTTESTQMTTILEGFLTRNLNHTESRFYNHSLSNFSSPVRLKANNSVVLKVDTNTLDVLELQETQAPSQPNRNGPVFQVEEDPHSTHGTADINSSADVNMLPVIPEHLTEDYLPVYQPPDLSEYEDPSMLSSLEPQECFREQFLVQVSSKADVFQHFSKVTKNTGPPEYNVLMFGIDSMSSLTFKRKLPQTLSFLKEKLRAVVFDGYNIVGDGTTQALFPIFVGQLQQEVSNVTTQVLDGVDFVWKHYKQRGYATLYAEDEPGIGAFNLRLKGFNQLPTDHYMRYFWQELKRSWLATECNKPYCTGSKPNHMYMLEYLEDFFNKYSNISCFAVGYSCELSHNDVNPSQYLDADLKTFLMRMHKKRHLTNTIVIIFADHGSRRGLVRKTYQGKIEERLPFLSVFVPESFRKTHRQLYKNLAENADKLTTPFDLHETLLHILHLNKHVRPSSGGSRGISLFHQIPGNRTCAEAGIETHWCTCVQEVPAPLDSPVVKGAAQAMVDAINALTVPARNSCVALTLNQTHSASLIMPNEKLLKFYESKEYEKFEISLGEATLDMVELQLLVETSPCQGMFEATVQVKNLFVEATGGYTLSYSVDENFVSRINTYGQQSACVCGSHPSITKFCCCQQFLRGEKIKKC